MEQRNQITPADRANIRLLPVLYDHKANRFAAGKDEHTKIPETMPIMIRACILSFAFRNNGIQAPFIQRRPPCTSTPQNVPWTSKGFQIECYIDRNETKTPQSSSAALGHCTYHEGLCHRVYHHSEILLQSISTCVAAGIGCCLVDGEQSRSWRLLSSFTAFVVTVMTVTVTPSPVS